MRAVLILVAITVAIIAGLRTSIVVTTADVCVTKNWFCLPYRSFEACVMEAAWYDGDWGEPDSGVVVQLAATEVHFGSRSSMRHLYTSLEPLTREAQRRTQVGRAKTPVLRS